jgi:uncharacterized protein YndB with AHSA1/START domain
MPDMVHLFTFAVPCEQAYRAIATADGIRKWWTSDADQFRQSCQKDEYDNRIKNKIRF